MKRRIFKIIKGLTLGIVASFVIASSVFAFEDFSTWVEVDAGADITISGSSNEIVSWVNVKHDEESYVYFDLGTTYNQSFIANFHFKQDSSTVAGGQVGHFGMSDTIGTFSDLVNGGASYGAWFSSFRQASPSARKIQVSEWDTTDSDGSGTININADTDYFVTFRYIKSDSAFGKVSVLLYDDVAKTNHLGTISEEFEVSHPYRYFYVMQANENPALAATSNPPHYGTTSNLTITFLPEPPTLPNVGVSNISFEPILNHYQADLSANITDDGGEASNAGFYYKLSSANESGWLWANSTGNYTTGENFSATIYPLTLGESYDYYAYAWNSGGSGNSSTENFTVSTGAIVSPTILTLAYPITLDSDNLWANIYGQVYYDGGENVTGYHFYREKGASDWISTNTTQTVNLTSTETFSTNLTGLTLSQTYEFTAFGENSAGNSTGGVSEFSLLTLYSPTVETVSSTSISNSDAILTGNVTNMGGDDSLLVYFQYRENGDLSWLTSSFTNYVQSIGVYSETLDGLQQNTTYEYRACAKSSILGYSTEYTDCGETYQFITLQNYSVPVMLTGTGSYVEAGFVSVNGTVYYDGGSPVTISAQYRKNGTSEWLDSEFEVYNASTGDVGTILLTGLEDKTTYQYRAKGINEEGTGYGSIREFYISFSDESITGDDTGITETGVIPVDMLKNWLQTYGLNNSTGYWLTTIVLMILMFVFFYSSSVLRIVMPATVLGAGIVTELIDTWLVILLAVPVALIIVWTIKKVG